MILDEGHLGARYQSPRFVARPFGVAQLLLVMDLLLHLKSQLSWINHESLDVGYFTLGAFFVSLFVFHYSGLAFGIKLFLSHNMSEQGRGRVRSLELLEPITLNPLAFLPLLIMSSSSSFSIFHFPSE